LITSSAGIGNTACAGAEDWYRKALAILKKICSSLSTRQMKVIHEDIATLSSRADGDFARQIDEILKASQRSRP
jgi:hypothetical protein